MAKKNPDEIAICLNCYKIKFKEKGKSDDKMFSVNQVFGTQSLFEIYQAFVKKIESKSAFRNKAEDRVLYLRETLQASKEGNIIAGVIMKGHNGHETAIDDYIKGEVKTVGKVTSEQYTCLPYFFLIYMKKDNPQDLIFIAQSYKQYGFKQLFEEAFRTFVIDRSAVNVTTQFNTVSIASLFKKYINDGKIYKLRFVKHTLSPSAEKLLYGDNIEKNHYEMEMSIKSPKGFWGVKSAINFEDASFIEQVQLDGFEYEEAYADVIVGGRKRVLNISKPSDFNAAYDITQDVDIDPKTKLPNFSDILSAAVDILNNDLIPNL